MPHERPTTPPGGHPSTAPRDRGHPSAATPGAPPRRDEPDPPAPAGHTHTHAAAALPPASARRARALLAALLVPTALLTALGAWWLWPDPADAPERFATDGPGVSYVRAEVLEVHPGPADADQVTVRLPDGDEVGMQVPAEYVPELAPGVHVRAARMEVAAVAFDPTADPEAKVTQHVFVDFLRGPPMGLLAAAFVVLVVLVARWRGLAALVGMGVGLAVVAGFTLPALLQGKPAVPVALVTSVVVMVAVLYLAHGVSVRTSTALAGTLVGLVATAGIAAWAGGSAHLTGLSGEYALDLMSVAPEVRLRSVLLCGMVLAGLGVLNDVTITQASAVWELHAASPGRSWRALYGQGMRIGRDHIASTVYTIVFAYVGAALPLVLLVSLSDRDLLGLLTSGEIAEEVVRTLVGSVGLVLAIPVTTALAATFVRLSAVAPVAPVTGRAGAPAGR